MTKPNTLIFVDLPSDDPAAGMRFYAEVFGWQNDEKPVSIYHHMVPGGFFPNPDGTDSAIGNLHLGIFGGRRSSRARHRGSKAPYLDPDWRRRHA